MRQRDLAHCAAVGAAIDDLGRICRGSALLNRWPFRLDAAFLSELPPRWKLLPDPLFLLGKWTVARVSLLATASFAAGAVPALTNQVTVQLAETAFGQIGPLNLTESAGPLQRLISSGLGLTVA